MIIGKRHALLWGPFFIFLVAFVLHISQMYVMFAALGLLAPVSYVLGRRKLAGIEVSRHGRSVMTAGERGVVTLTVRNEGRLRQFFLTVRDKLPGGLQSPENGRVLLADLPPGAEERLRYSLQARRRGVYSVGPPTLEGSDYLGLYKFTCQVGDTAELLVYPRAMPIPNLWPRGLQGRTPHKASRRSVGPSTQFYGVRDYSPGDDPRRVDWKTSARRRKLVVTETEQSESSEAVLILDLDADAHVGEGDDSTIEHAATLAASLATEAISRGCSIGLVADGAEDHGVPISPSPRQQLHILEALARVQSDANRPLLEVLVAHEREFPPGCSIAVISPAVGTHALAVASRLRGLQRPVVWFAQAPHTYRDAGVDAHGAHDAFTARLEAQGARVVPIHGDLPLETNLWKGGRRGRRA